MDAFARYHSPLARQPRNSADGTELDEMETEVQTIAILGNSDEFAASKRLVLPLPSGHVSLPEDPQEQKPVEFHDHADQLATYPAEAFHTHVTPLSPSTTSSDKPKRTRTNKHIAKGNNNHGRAGRGRCLQCRRWKQAVGTLNCRSRLSLVSI